MGAAGVGEVGWTSDFVYTFLNNTDLYPSWRRHLPLPAGKAIWPFPLFFVCLTMSYKYFITPYCLGAVAYDFIFSKGVIKVAF